MDEFRYTVSMALKGDDVFNPTSGLMLSSFSQEFCFVDQPKPTDVINALVANQSLEEDQERIRAYNLLIAGVREVGIPQFSGGRDFAERTFGMDTRPFGIRPSGLIAVDRKRFINNSPVPISGIRSINMQPGPLVNIIPGRSVVVDTPRFNMVRVSVPDIILSSGSVFPASPVGGQKFYRPDLSIGGPSIEFTFDSGRSKWLGELEAIGAGRAGLQTTGYLRLFNGMLMSDTLGVLVPYDITIVAISLLRGDTTNGNLEIRRNGTTVATVPATGLFGVDMGLDVDMRGPSNIGLFWESGGLSTTNLQARLWFRRLGEVIKR